MRYLLLDKILKWIPGQEAIGLKNVSLSEDFFEDHFPLKPIMPGTLVIEGMAQLAGLLLEETLKKSGRKIKALLSLVEKARFRRPIYPGSTLIYHCRISQYNELGGRTLVVAEVEELKVAESELLFSFHDLNNPTLEKRRDFILSNWLMGATFD